jgi:type IV pilus assembly protein PilO
MSIQDAFKDLQGFDVSDLDFDNIGSWPIAIKVIVWVLVLVLVLALGYTQIIADMQDDLGRTQQKEQTLRKDFENKAFQAANLDAYRDQMVEMKESFGALVSQLPTDTEVPGLLEDITNEGVENGLNIVSITLGNERAKEFYIELPIDIVLKGSYHDIGAFVSAIAGLPRIVTLHKFNIVGDKNDPRLLTMKITAKTYRYKSEGA